MDSFICGNCAAVLHDIGEFLGHKKMCITASLDKASPTAEVMPQPPASVQATVLGADGKSTTFIIINGDVDDKVCSTDVDAHQLHNTSSSSQETIAVEIASCDTGIVFKSHMLTSCF